jgi:hypothetical protein
LPLRQCHPVTVKFWNWKTSLKLTIENFNVILDHPLPLHRARLELGTLSKRHWLPVLMFVAWKEDERIVPLAMNEQYSFSYIILYSTDLSMKTLWCCIWVGSSNGRVVFFSFDPESFCSNDLKFYIYDIVISNRPKFLATYSMTCVCICCIFISFTVLYQSPDIQTSFSNM